MYETSIVTGLININRITTKSIKMIPSIKQTKKVTFVVLIAGSEWV